MNQTINNSNAARLPNLLQQHHVMKRHSIAKYPLCCPMACRFLDNAALSDRAGLTGHRPAVSRTQVEETKAFIGIMPLFLCICIYQMAYDPSL
jgi:hypothetical protein